MRIGNAKINTNPCTQAEQNANWNVVNQFLTNFTALANADHKVAVNATDESNATADYLGAKITETGTSVPNDVLVRSEVVGDLSVNLFWTPSDIVNYDDSPGVSLQLILFEGALAWSEFTDTVDSLTVKVSGTDSVAGYFHDCVEDTDTIVSGTDLIVVGNVVGGSGTDQTERFAVDVSAISGYDATEFRLLGIEANVSAYKTITAVGVELVDDSTFITNLIAALGIGQLRNIRKGRVTVAIPAATGPLTAQWGTTGKVKLQDRDTGVLDASDQFVANDNIGTAWPIDAQVTVDTDYTPPRVLGGSCSSVTWT